VSGTKAGRARRGWRLREEQTLLEMWNAGATGSAIGKALGRSNSGVYNYVAQHHDRLGLKLRTQMPWHAAEERVIASELEGVLKRLQCALPHRGRPTITQRMTAWLMSDAKRVKARKQIRPIADLGGMSEIGPVRKFGTARAESPPKVRAKAAA
jgi:hypothetical protein